MRTIRWLTLSVAILFFLSTALASNVQAIDVVPKPKEMEQFSIRLYASLAKSRSGQSFVVAPRSAYQTLAALHAGANGQTLRELTALIGKATSNVFPRLQANESAELLITNRMWVQASYPICPAFQSEVEKSFQFSVEEADFEQDSKGVVEHINGEIARLTKGKINRILTIQEVGSDTRLVVTASNWFRAAWKYPFNPEKNLDADFWVSDRKRVPAKFMRQETSFKYAEFKEHKALCMPYVTQKLAMIWLLPNERDGLSALEAQLTEENLEHWYSSMTERLVLAVVPKFSLTNRISLIETLRGLGLVTLFDSKTADLSRMTSAETLFVSSLVQQSMFEVDEKGASGAAATAAVNVPRIAPESVVFEANHPFLFVVIDTTTGDVLFLGRFSAPTSN